MRLSKFVLCKIIWRENSLKCSVHFLLWVFAHCVWNSKIDQKKKYSVYMLIGGRIWARRNVITFEFIERNIFRKQILRAFETVCTGSISKVFLCVEQPVNYSFIFFLSLLFLSVRCVCICVLFKDVSCWVLDICVAFKNEMMMWVMSLNCHFNDQTTSANWLLYLCSSVQVWN